MVLDRAAQTIEHTTFAEIVRYLAPGDVLVANRSRVLPARLCARKSTGGEVELLLLQPHDRLAWSALARPSRRLRAGMELAIEHSDVAARLEERTGEGQWLVRFHGPGDVEAKVREAGTLPLPPYIHNPNAPQERYQTVYADREGSVAAPTAGLHFSQQLLQSVRDSGVDVQLVTLHVGLGTFRPVTVSRVQDHTMHAEWGEVPDGVADAVNAARDRGGRAIAVGTTTTRLLESAVHSGRVTAFSGQTDQFIYPGYTFRAIDALVTNFHLPRSTLLMLVSAFAGREFVLSAYHEAIRRRYRFYSFGDAMLIL
jgi:S-adenosylmethionine:tRNA ribosyltransferase-isomerase